MKSKIKLTGSKTTAYVLSVEAGRYYADMQLDYEELVRVRDLLMKKLK